MKPSEIEVGTPYWGVDGRPRTVLSVNRVADEVAYMTEDNPRILRATVKQFAAWAVEEA